MKNPIECLVMEKVSLDQPAYQIDLHNFNDLPGCFLADPGILVPHKIDMILDGDITRRSRCPEHKSFYSKCGAIFDETSFGWVVGASFKCQMFMNEEIFIE